MEAAIQQIPRVARDDSRLPRSARNALRFALLALPIFGCGSDATDPTEAAKVRVVNASSTSAAIDAMTEGRYIAQGLTFQNTNMPPSCQNVEQGSAETIGFKLSLSGGDLGAVDVPIVANQNYTLVFFRANTATAFQDVFTSPGSGQNAIRFINATSSSGDIYLTGVSDAIGLTSVPTVAELGPAQASGFNAVRAPGGTFALYPASQVRVRMFDVGVKTGTPRADFTIMGLPANHVGTAIITPAASSGSTGFVVSTCAG